ncbi:TPA: site-specific DNA-methyltransferase [Streptococcus suis]
MNSEKILSTVKKLYNDELIYSDDQTVLINGDSLELLKKIPSNSIALILTDPPYHSTKKKNIKGDTDFATDSEFIKWMELFAIEWRRILKPNGSIFCFCSAEMSPWLQVMFHERFNILSEITWTKPNAPGYDGWKQKMKKESLRQWYPHSERIIFMEPAYEGNLFRTYFGNKLKEWRTEAKVTMHYLAEVTQSYGKVNHGGAISNWEAGRNIPNKKQYELLIGALSEKIDYNFPPFEDAIRPFKVNNSVEFTDIWNFQNVRQYRGKHPAEKPIDLLSHAINSTTNEGDIILDCFGGSGATAIAAIESGRKCIYMEIEKKWALYACDRVKSKLNELV